MTGITRSRKSTGGLLAYRMVGAALLDVGTYEGVEADPSALRQAVAVVLLSSAAAGIGVSGWEGPSLSTVVVVSLLAMVTWLAWAVLMFQIGTRIVPEPATRSSLAEMLRTVGFAASPGVLMAAGALPRMAAPAFIIAWLWMFVATVVAVQHALDFQHRSRAIVVCALATALVLLMAVALGLLFGPALS